jgi:hypothetical protein
MNRTLAHGRHAEWVLRAQRDCGRGAPDESFHGNLERGTHGSELSGGHRNPAQPNNDFRASAAELPTDGGWPESTAVAA